MDHIINYIFIAALSTLTAVMSNPTSLPIVALFSSVSLAAVTQIMESSERERTRLLVQPVSSALLLFLVAISWVYPEFIYFSPLLIYMIANPLYLLPLALVIPLWVDNTPALYIAILFVLGCALSYVLAHRTRREIGFTQKHFDTVDLQQQEYLHLQRKNQELIANRELEISNERLQERNRISTEIHDNVGHMLSSTILQVGALEVIADESEKPYINSIQETLKGAMQQIRNSVHDIHQDSLDMKREIEKVLAQFQFCESSSQIQVETEPSTKLHYAILAIVREALTNTTKHSNATFLNVTLSQMGGKYHLIVADNGTQAAKPPTSTAGIGLVTMEERVMALGGSIHISRDNGYHIFVSLPVERRIT